MSIDIVADRLDSAPSRWRLPEESPRRLGKPIGFAVPASEQEEQRFFGEIRHRKLLRLRNDRVGGSGIVHEGVGGDAHATPWRNDAGAPVAKAVAIGRYRDRRVDYQVVTADEIGHPCEVDVEVEYHRGWLGALVDHFEADANLHHGPPIGMVHSLQTSCGVHAVAGTPRTKWIRSQRFRLTPAGREAGRAYRQDIVASRVEAGRKSFDAARAEW